MRRAGTLVGFVALLGTVVILLLLRAQWIDGKLRSVRGPAVAQGATPYCAATSRIVMAGDSRVSQWPVDHLAGRPVVNVGRAGEAALQMAQRYRRDVLASCPAVILIQSGVNDLVAASLTGEPEAGEIVARVSAALIRMAEDGAAGGAAVFMTTLIPPATPGLLRRLVWSGALVGYVAEVNARLRQHRWRGAVTLVDFAARLDPDNTGVLPAAFRRDTLHLNRAGYDRLRAMLPFLSQTPTPGT